jgi:hypothetical protein
MLVAICLCLGLFDESFDLVLGFNEGTIDLFFSVLFDGKQSDGFAS